MSEFNVTWRKYGLSDNPYFNSPLTIEKGTIPITSFIGRKKEKQELKRVIEMASDVRFAVIGEAGIGKTSLVNYVRNEASKNQFFTPSIEIEINRIMSGNEFIILTLSVIYDEIKKQQIKVKEDLSSKLDALYELTKYGELSHDLANITQLNRQKLIDLFREVVNEVVNPRFKGMILHYDNLDNINDLEALSEMLSEVRDFLLTKQVIFIFVSDTFFPIIINTKKRVGQIFLTPPLEVNAFSYEDIKNILYERVEQLKINEKTQVTIPHTEEALSTLYTLHRGNIREILNSLMSCVLSLQSSNMPIQITQELLQDILFQKVNDCYMSKLTLVEREILIKILENNIITPTELSKLTKKTLQNISSKYLPKLMSVCAIRVKSAEGRNKYYEVMPEIKWWNLKRSEQEKIETKTKTDKKISDLMQKSLSEFF